MKLQTFLPSIQSIGTDPAKVQARQIRKQRNEHMLHRPVKGWMRLCHRFDLWKKLCLLFPGLRDSRYLLTHNGLDGNQIMR